MFHLLPYFNVSDFIQKEWDRYWKENDQIRLTTALIINEQNVIQTPVIEHPVYKKKVFHSMIFSFQDWLHFSCVLFPTCGGEVYGASVNGFKSLSKRINLGKRLAKILFHPRFFHIFLSLPKKHHILDQEMIMNNILKQKQTKTPFLRATFPVIEHHHSQYEDWSLAEDCFPVMAIFSRKASPPHPPNRLVL